MSIEFQTSRSKTFSQQFGKKTSRLSYIGIILLLLWLLTTFINMNPEIYLLIGGTSLLFTLGNRMSSKRREDIDVGGGVLGYLLVWIIAQFFYTRESELVSSTDFQVKEVMIAFLFALFVGWFLIKDKTPTKELVLGFSPLVSSFLLNLWKIAVLIELLTLFSDLEKYQDLATTFFLLVGFFEIILLLARRVKINYAELILNPFQLLVTIFAGTSQATKWILLVFVFIVLERLDVGLGSVGLILTAIGVGIITLIEALTRTTLASGVIGSQFESGQALIPMVFNEINTIDASVVQIYETKEIIDIRKTNSITTLPEKSLLFRIPFSPELERSGGIFLIQAEIGKSNVTTLKKESSVEISKIIQKEVQGSVQNEVQKKRFRKHKRRQQNGLNMRTKGFFRIDQQEWERIQRSLVLLDKNSIATDLGLENSDEIDKRIQESLQKVVQVQEEIRSRIRGVPAPTRRSISSKIQNGTLHLPPELLKGMKLKEGEEIELVPGKDEYIFYGRLKRKTKGFGEE